MTQTVLSFHWRQRQIHWVPWHGQYCLCDVCGCSFLTGLDTSVAKHSVFSLVIVQPWPPSKQRRLHWAIHWLGLAKLSFRKVEWLSLIWLCCLSDCWRRRWSGTGTGRWCRSHAWSRYTIATSDRTRGYRENPVN